MSTTKHSLPKFRAIALACLLAAAMPLAQAAPTYQFQVTYPGLVGTSSVAAAGQGTLTVTDVTFPATTVGTSAVAKYATVTNVGTATVTVSGTGVSNNTNFNSTGGACATLAVNATCLISVNFLPTVASVTAGDITTSLNVFSDATNAQATGTLYGTGVGVPVASVPAGTTYNMAANKGSASSLAVTLKNTGNSTLTLSTPAALVSGSSAAFTMGTSTCGTALAPLATCTVNVTFTPTVTTAVTATLRFTTNASPSVLDVSLSGTGSLVTPTFSTTFAVPAATFGTTPPTLVAPASDSSGAFSFTSSATTVATVSGTTLTLSKMGSSTITVTQAATGNYAATSATATLVVNGTAVVLSGFTVPTKMAGAAAFTLTAPTAAPSSGGVITYTSDTPSVATVSGSTVTVIGVGQALITATQASVNNYASTSISATLTVTPSVRTYAVLTGAPGITLSNGDLTYTGGSGWNSTLATIGKSSGKWYWEATTPYTVGASMLGIADAGFVTTGGYLGGSRNSIGYYRQANFAYFNWSGAINGGTVLPNYAAGDVYMFALDMDNGALYLGMNGTWVGTPTSGSLATNAAAKGLSGTVYPAVTGQNSPPITLNFGASGFSYVPPSGYNAGVFN